MAYEIHTFIMRVQFTGDFASQIDETPGGQTPAVSVDKRLRRIMCQLQMDSALPKKAHVWVAAPEIGGGTLEMRWETSANGNFMKSFVNAFVAFHVTPQLLNTQGVRRVLLYKFNRVGVTSVPKSWRPFFSAYDTAGRPLHDPKPINAVPQLHPRPFAPTAPAPPPLATPSTSSICTPPYSGLGADPTPSDTATGLDARRNQDQLAACPSSVLAAELVHCRARCDQYRDTAMAEQTRAVDLEIMLGRTVSEKENLASENAIMRREMQALRDRTAQDEGASSLKRKREGELSHRSVHARTDDMQLKTEPASDHDALHSVSALESRVHELQASLDSEILARQAVEHKLRDVQRECKEPFVVPAMLQAFLRLATMGDRGDRATDN